MSGLDRLLEAVRDWSDRGIDFAMATVVGVRGSTYRGLAARQLVAADGAAVGTVSGGCLDSDLLAVALSVMESGIPRLVEFDLTADDEAVWGWGIGCNGATSLLVEPADSAREVARQIRSARGEQRALAVAHLLDPGPLPDVVGSRRFFRADGTTVGSLGDVDGAVDEAAARALASGHHEVLPAGDARVFIEVVGAPSRLLVCGAGHDAVPLVTFGALLGFEVVVVDDRRQFLTRDRFPDAVALVNCAPREVAAHVDVDSRTYAVVMSHNYLRDLDYLACLLHTPVAYVGTLGPGARLERLLGDLEGQGVSPTDRDLSILHGPAGLDIGAEGPREIAWAVMAEILAVRRGADGGFLRDRKGPPAVRRAPPAGRRVPSTVGVPGVEER